MLLKLRKWLTIACVGLFVITASYLAFTIDGKVKGRLKGLRQDQKTSHEHKESDLNAANKGVFLTSANPNYEGITIDYSDSQLSRCKVWMLVWQQLLEDEFWRCSVERAVEKIVKDSNQEVNDYQNDDTIVKDSVCLIGDRFSHPALNLSSGQSGWLWRLQDKYGKQKITITAPDYATVFAGTLFEEMYVNSRDMSYLGGALIWALIWKFGGLFIHQDSLLLLNLKSYYNFVALNSFGNGSTLALVQLDAQHGLSLNALHHLMEQHQRRSAYQTFFPYHHNFQYQALSRSTIRIRPLTDKDWSQEVETYCGRKLTKELGGKFCQDTEIVDSELLPKLSDKKTVKQWIRNVATSPYSGQALAVQINLSDGGRKSLLQSRNVRKWLRGICPVIFNMEQK